jgi:hypothetical protein
MKIATREIDHILLLDLFGPFPDSDDERAATVDAICGALTGQTHFAIVFHKVHWLRSVDIGLLLRSLKAAKVPMGGTGPFVTLVAEDDRVRSTLRVMEAPFRVFATEAEALSSLCD